MELEMSRAKKMWIGLSSLGILASFLFFAPFVTNTSADDCKTCENLDEVEFCAATTLPGDQGWRECYAGQFCFVHPGNGTVPPIFTCVNLPCFISDPCILPPG